MKQTRPPEPGDETVEEAAEHAAHTEEALADEAARAADRPAPS